MKEEVLILLKVEQTKEGFMVWLWDFSKTMCPQNPWHIAAVQRVWSSFPTKGPRNSEEKNKFCRER